MYTWVETRWNKDWIDVELPTKVAEVRSPTGAMSHTEVLILFGIQSTKHYY